MKLRPILGVTAIAGGVWIIYISYTLTKEQSNTGKPTTASLVLGGGAIALGAYLLLSKS